MFGINGRLGNAAVNPDGGPARPIGRWLPNKTVFELSLRPGSLDEICRTVADAAFENGTMVPEEIRYSC